ncbi:MAG: hypothetical protein HGB35_07830 [Geobacteraceae bacterium]|nr:hypothetical protein [Geobacteraceae bacterium]
MSPDRVKMENNSNKHKTTDRDDSLPGRVEGTDRCPASDFGEIGTQAVSGKSLWKSTVSLIIVLYSFVIVLFYMVRFAVSAWEAGARGIYGL